MARSRLCRVCRDFHDHDKPWPRECAAHFAPPPQGRAPYIRTDGMEPIRSMADGRIYDSKSAYYGSVRAAGCEVVGDDKAPFDRRPEFTPEGVGADLSRAYDELVNR